MPIIAVKIHFYSLNICKFLLLFAIVKYNSSNFFAGDIAGDRHFFSQLFFSPFFLPVSLESNSMNSVFQHEHQQKRDEKLFFLTNQYSSLLPTPFLNFLPGTGTRCPPDCTPFAGRTDMHQMPSRTSS